MADNLLIKKLKLKPEQRALILDSPTDYLDKFQPPPEGAELSGQLEGQFD